MIRLVALWPGDLYDYLNIEILHVPFISPASSKEAKPSLKAVQNTLPYGWTVYETLEDRFIFENNATEESSWTHPDPEIEQIVLTTAGPDHEFKPVYEALSYVWGERAEEELAFVKSGSNSLECPDSISSTTVKLRPNLAAAVRFLRLPDRRRTLWVDSLCINQDDIAERSEQIRHMGDIYQLADRVIVWLGRATADSGLALETLRCLGKQVEVLHSGARLRAPGCVESDWFRANSRLPYEEKTARALNSLIERPWFKRLWVWQEVQLANQHTIVQCGIDYIEWYFLRRAIIVLAANQKLPDCFSEKKFIYSECSNA